MLEALMSVKILVITTARWMAAPISPELENLGVTHGILKTSTRPGSACCLFKMLVTVSITATISNTVLIYFHPVHLS